MTKETAINILNNRYQKCVVDSLDATLECEYYNTALSMAIKALEKEDAMQWIPSTVNDICSRCGGRGTSAFDYCPHCGRKAVK